MTEASIGTQITITEDVPETMRLAVIGPRWAGDRWERAEAAADAAGPDEWDDAVAVMTAIEVEQAEGERLYGEAWSANAIRIAAERGYDARIILTGEHTLGTRTDDDEGREQSAEELIWQAAHDETPLPQGW